LRFRIAKNRPPQNPKTKRIQLDAAPANDEPRENFGGSRWQTFWLWFGRVMWGANLLLLVGTFAWILWDPKFPLTARALVHKRAFLQGESLASFFYTLSPDLGHRLSYLVDLMGVAVLTLVGIVVTLFTGSREHRRLRTWFAFTLLVAIWLTLTVTWPEMAWQGQRIRMWTQLEGFQQVAAALRENWPKADGELPEVGTFMAYPRGNPRTLMILSAPQPPTTGIQFSAVERSDGGALRFELTGYESNAWLEWHPQDSLPESFTGGLENTYSRTKSAPLGNGWYLVRYR
jgi:hypothetical protein